MPQRNYANTAQPTSLTGVVDNAAVTLPVASTTGYPSPPFLVAIERGTANEEVVLVQGKTSNALTNCLRGYDSTVAVAHASGKAVEHTTAAMDYRESSEHIYNTALDQHPQYLNTVRHSQIDHGPLSGSFQPPVGTLYPYVGTTSPDALRFLLCYGQAVSRTGFATLFTLMGTTFGTGDGSTTFNLPDLRGRVIAGLDNIGGSPAGIMTGVTALGARGGETAHVLTIGELASHSHGGNSGAGGSHTHSSSAGSVAHAACVARLLFLRGLPQSSKSPASLLRPI
jgi:microcystin-dependent protein